jgi:hypothetical protein
MMKIVNLSKPMSGTITRMYPSGMAKILWASGHIDIKFKRDYTIKKYRKGGKYEKYAELL